MKTPKACDVCYALTSVGLAMSLLLGAEAAAEPIFFKDQTIKNDTRRAANDLSLRFSGEVKNVSVMPPGLNASIPASGVDATTNTAFWNSGTIKPEVPAGKTATIFWGGDAAGILVSEATFWTRNGEQIGGVTAFGQAPQFSADLGFATFLNPHTFDIIYSNVRLFRDNDLANFGTDKMFDPTGTLVTGVPSTFTLNPGETTTLFLGATSIDKYQLALASVAAASTPSDALDVGTAAAVPEPTTLILVGTAAVGLGLARWRQRRRNH